MKLHSTSTQTVTTAGAATGPSAFKMDFNDKMFRVLTDGLYTKKVEAVIRELSCNAYDSHIEAGKQDVPIDVHLPTLLEPYFFIEDYGIGLDHDGIINLYTTVGASSKDGTNSLIGAYGLGSKSPFAYCDTFTVVACKDEMERTYSASVIAGMPHITLISERKVDGKQNGVKVQLPVKTNHFSEFSSVAAQVFKYFPVLPNIVSGMIEIRCPEYITSNDTVAILKDAGQGYGYSIDVVCGIVSYQFDARQASQWHNRQCEIVDEDRSARIKTLCSLYQQRLVTVFAPLGAVAIPPSRETLEYVDQTFEYMFSDDVYHATIDAIQQILTQYEKMTPWQKASAYNKQQAQLEAALDTQKKTNDPYRIQFEGISIDSAFRYKVMTDLANPVSAGDFRRYAAYQNRRTITTSDTYILVDDVSQTKLSRCIRYFALHQHKKGVRNIQVVVVKDYVPDMLGIPKSIVFKLSDYIDPTTASQKKTSKTQQVQRAVGHVKGSIIRHDSRNVSTLTNIPIDQSANGILFMIKARVYTESRVVVDSSFIDQYVDHSNLTHDRTIGIHGSGVDTALRLAAVMDKQVVVINTTEYKTLKKLTNNKLETYGWVCVDKATEKAEQQLDTDFSINAQLMKDYKGIMEGTYYALPGDCRGVMPAIVKACKAAVHKLPSEIRTKVEVLDTVFSKHETAQKLLNLVLECSIQVDNDNSFATFLVERCPLIRSMQFGIISTDQKQLDQFTNLIQHSLEN